MAPGWACAGEVTVALTAFTVISRLSSVTEEADATENSSQSRIGKSMPIRLIPLTA